MGPIDLIFFPVKIEIRPDISVEISTGNTSEISTSDTLKSRNIAKNIAKICDFHLQIPGL